MSTDQGKPEWERLPVDTQEFCRRTSSGWASKDLPECCGKTAAWILRETCGCGQHDMSVQLCEGCHQEWMEKDKARKERLESTQVKVHCMGCGHSETVPASNSEKTSKCGECGCAALNITFLGLRQGNRKRRPKRRQR